MDLSQSAISEGSVLICGLGALGQACLERLLTERLGLQRRERLRVGSWQDLIVGWQKVVEPIRTLLAGERVGVQTAGFSEGRGGLDSQLERLKRTQLVGVGLLSNVHAALALQQSHPSCRLAVLAHALEASDQLGRFLGGISVISGADLAADALVATAFVERVERVLQINRENQLVVRYRVEPNDQLCGLTIARVENGYGMNVMARLDSLRRVECGECEAPLWCVELQANPHPHERFVVKQCLSRFLNLAPGPVQNWLDGNWHRSRHLDRDLAELMCQELQRLRVETRRSHAAELSTAGITHD